MRWGKFILIFQAVVTLVIGILLLSLVLVLDASVHEDDISGDQDDLSKFEFAKERFYQGSYIFVLISCIELIIIWRLLK